MVMFIRLVNSIWHYHFYVLKTLRNCFFVTTNGLFLSLDFSINAEVKAALVGASNKEVTSQINGSFSNMFNASFDVFYWMRRSQPCPRQAGSRESNRVASGQSQ